MRDDGRGRHPTRLTWGSPASSGMNSAQINIRRLDREPGSIGRITSLRGDHGGI